MWPRALADSNPESNSSLGTIVLNVLHCTTLVQLLRKQNIFRNFLSDVPGMKVETIKSVLEKIRECLVSREMFAILNPSTQGICFCKLHAFFRIRKLLRGGCGKLLFPKGRFEGSVLITGDCSRMEYTATGTCLL
jgi:hypothetical protein